jgi:Integrase core domain
MGRTGSALDNAVAESFNSTLEWELLRNNHFHTCEEARHAFAAWIDDYNSLPTFQQRHAEPHRLRAWLHSAAHHKPRYQTRRGTRGMKPDGDGFAAAVVPTERSARLRGRPSGSDLPARTARRSALIKIKPIQTKSLRIQGITIDTFIWPPADTFTWPLTGVWCCPTSCRVGD